MPTAGTTLVAVLNMEGTHYTDGQRMAANYWRQGRSSDVRPFQCRNWNTAREDYCNASLDRHGDAV